MYRRGLLLFFLCICFFANAQKINVVSYTFDDDRFGLVKFANSMKSDSTDYGIENGKYVLQNFQKRKGQMRWINYNYGLNSNANTSYKVSVVQLSGAQDFSYGMMVHGEDGNNYLLFGIASNGYYLIEFVKSGMVTKISNGWVKSSIVKTGYNTVNDLYVEKKGNDYRFFLNDIAIQTATLSLTKFSPKVGIFANSNMKVAFDKLEIDQWIDQKTVSGKIVPGYTPSNRLPVAAKPFLNVSKKNQLYGITYGAFDYWYGVMDKDGYRYIDPVFKYAYSTGDYIIGGNESKNELGVFDWQGNIIIPPIMKKINSSQYQGITYFSCRSESGLWGLLDQSGKTILPFVYSYIDLVSEGHVYMKNANGWGVADLNGNIKIKAGSIEDADELSKSSFRLPVRVKQGQIIAKAKTQDGGLKGIMDLQGNWVVLPKYFDINYVDTNQSYIVYSPKSTDKNRLVKGVIDKNGKEIIPTKYSTLFVVGKNYVAAEGDDPEGYDTIEESDEDDEEALLDLLDALDGAKDTRKWGIFSATGNTLAPLKYADISTSADINILQCKQPVNGSKNETLSLYDQSTKTVINLSSYEIEMKDSVLLKEKPKGDYRRNYSYYADGLINVGKGGKWGFLDKLGKVQIPFQYDFASAFSNGMAMVKKNKEWFYINKAGKRLSDSEIPKSNPDKELPPIRPGAL